MVIIEFLLSNSLSEISATDECDESVARAFKVSVKNISVDDSFVIISLLSELV